MTVTFFRDGYADRPTTPRAVLEHEVKRLKMLTWSDPDDSDVKQRLAAAEAALATFDARGRAP